MTLNTWGGSRGGGRPKGSGIKPESEKIQTSQIRVSSEVAEQLLAEAKRRGISARSLADTLLLKALTPADTEEV